MKKIIKITCLLLAVLFCLSGCVKKISVSSDGPYVIEEADGYSVILKKQNDFADRETYAFEVSNKGESDFYFGIDDLYANGVDLKIEFEERVPAGKTMVFDSVIDFSRVDLDSVKKVDELKFRVILDDGSGEKGSSFLIKTYQLTFEKKYALDLVKAGWELKTCPEFPYDDVLESYGINYRGYDDLELNEKDMRLYLACFAETVLDDRYDYVYTNGDMVDKKTEDAFNNRYMAAVNAYNSSYEKEFTVSVNLSIRGKEIGTQTVNFEPKASKNFEFPITHDFVKELDAEKMIYPLQISVELTDADGVVVESARFEYYLYNDEKCQKSPDKFKLSLPDNAENGYDFGVRIEKFRDYITVDEDDEKAEKPSDYPYTVSVSIPNNSDEDYRVSVAYSVKTFGYTVFYEDITVPANSEEKLEYNIDDYYKDAANEGEICPLGIKVTYMDADGKVVYTLTKIINFGEAEKQN
ncbi:MAG: hypothetical protein IKT46_03680 [Clostridia bacterium]|nr:hypothetical protein [Clostridia bacterium]